MQYGGGHRAKPGQSERQEPHISPMHPQRKEREQEVREGLAILMPHHSPLHPWITVLPSNPSHCVTDLTHPDSSQLKVITRISLKFGALGSLLQRAWHLTPINGQSLNVAYHNLHHRLLFVLTDTD